jgi:hypothetical protein
LIFYKLVDIDFDPLLCLDAEKMWVKKGKYKENWPNQTVSFSVSAVQALGFLGCQNWNCRFDSPPPPPPPPPTAQN